MSAARVLPDVRVAQACADVARHRPDAISSHLLGLAECVECRERWRGGFLLRRKGCTAYREARSTLVLSNGRPAAASPTTPGTPARPVDAPTPATGRGKPRPYPPALPSAAPAPSIGRLFTRAVGHAAVPFREHAGASGAVTGGAS